MNTSPGDPSINGAVEDTVASFLLDEGADDPATFYGWLHRTAPVHQRPSGTLLLARHADCQAVLRDPRLGKGPGSPDDIVPRRGAPARSALPESVFTASLVHMNPPEHTRVRDVVSQAFSRRRVDRLRPLIERRADELLRSIREREQAELVDDLGYGLAVWVIGELLGVPEPDRDAFRSLVRRQGVLYEPGVTDHEIGDGLRAAREMAAYFAALLRERRRQPADDLLSDLVTTGTSLSKQEQVGLPMLLMGAGFDTTTALVANTFGLVLTQPDALPRLRADPSLIPLAVEESLRFESPIQINARFTLEATDVCGHRVEAGQWVVALIGAANRDPAAYDEPDRFDLVRFGKPGAAAPLSFSAGIHHCLGAPLARLEASIALERWLASGVRLEPVDTTLTWRPHRTHRCVLRLPVVVRGS